MTLDEILKQARVLDRFDGVGVTKTNRTLQSYCQLAATHLQEALTQERLGRPAYYTGREGKRVLQGLFDPSLETSDVDYMPTKGEPIGWGSDVADAILVLLALCRERRIPLEALLERKLKSRRGGKK